MSIYLADSSDITAVADAIRTKGGTSEVLTFPQGFVDAIDQLSTSLPTYDGTVETANNSSYLTFTGTNDFTTFLMGGSAGIVTWDGKLEYSTDLLSWTEWDGTTIQSQNKKLYMRGIGNTHICVMNGWHFAFNYTKVSIDGNIMCLLDYKMVEAGIDPPMGPYCFARMFSSDSNLIKGPELPSLHLNDHCYYQMFRLSTDLEITPRLPAPAVAPYCYNEMFYGCTKIISLPALPATNTRDGCYSSMFNGCTNIKLSETKTGEYQYEYRIPSNGNGTDSYGLSSMFSNTGGTFTGNPTINTTYYTTNPPVE